MMLEAKGGATMRDHHFLNPLPETTTNGQRGRTKKALLTSSLVPVCLVFCTLGCGANSSKKVDNTSNENEVKTEVAVVQPKPDEPETPKPNLPKFNELTPSSFTGLLGVPLPSGAKFVDRKPGNPAATQDPRERYSTTNTAAEIAAFYDREMPKAGWTKRPNSIPTGLIFDRGNAQIGVLISKNGSTFTLMGSALDDTTSPPSKVAATSNLIPHKVINRDSFLNNRLSLDVLVDLVDGRLPTKDELGAISQHLVASQNFERKFVCFYLPGMKVNSGCFATAHHNPTMEDVKVLDFNIPENYRNLTSTANVPSKNASTDRGLEQAIAIAEAAAKAETMRKLVEYQEAVAQLKLKHQQLIEKYKARKAAYDKAKPAYDQAIAEYDANRKLNLAFSQLKNAKRKGGLEGLRLKEFAERRLREVIEKFPATQAAKDAKKLLDGADVVPQQVVVPEELAAPSAPGPLVLPEPPTQIKVATAAYDKYSNADRPRLIRIWWAELRALKRAIEDDQRRLQNATTFADQQHFRDLIEEYKGRLARHIQNDPPYIQKGDPLFTGVRVPSRKPPANVSQPKQSASYRIVKTENVSFGVVRRFNLRVSLSARCSRSEVETMAKAIVADFTKKERVNAISILFYGPGSPTSGSFDVAMVEWAPNGNWSDADAVRAGDYAAFAYRVAYKQPR